MSTDLSKAPAPDAAEHEAYFPSPYSLSQYVAPTTDFDGADGAPQAGDGPRTILVIAADERYVPVEGERYFSSGNHPVETLLPLMHLRAAGYDVEVATVSGAMAKLELWAFPTDDDAVARAHEELLPQLREPKALADVVAGLGEDSPYAAVFVPGGHGALVRLPESREVGQALQWFVDNERPVITLCHGPAALLAATGADGANVFAGYEIAAFPDSLDCGANVEIGYLPGRLTWLFGERLQQAGLTIVNDDMTGRVHRDRVLLTGDSPLAANALGRLAVETLTGGTYA